MKYNPKKIIVPRFEESQGFYTTKERSRIMTKIRAKNTRPEILFRKALWGSGIRYRIHGRKFPGNPDIIIQKHKVTIFIDGGFWHGFNWLEKKDKIKTNRDFWIPKIERNMQRDVENNLKLEELGFKVFRFWEHEVKKDLEFCVHLVKDYILSLPTK